MNTIISSFKNNKYNPIRIIVQINKIFLIASDNKLGYFLKIQLSLIILKMNFKLYAIHHKAVPLSTASGSIKISKNKNFSIEKWESLIFYNFLQFFKQNNHQEYFEISNIYYSNYYQHQLLFELQNVSSFMIFFVYYSIKILQ